LSRTARRRTLNDNSIVEANPCRTRSDEDLLIELQDLCAQPLDASYRRKLEAIALLLQRREQHQIEQCAKASVRTVQRWTNRVRRLGVSALQRRTCSSPSKLSMEQRARLAADLGQPPSSQGSPQRCWTAALLMRHVRENYAATISLRHCRRLLTIFEVTRPARTDVTQTARLSMRATVDHQASTTTDRREVLAPQPLGDYARKRQGLASIKRLASSGMPLQPFAYTLFDVINDAVPHDEASPGITATLGRSSRWIIRDFDYSRWLPQMHKYLLVADSEVSGFRPPLLPQNPHTVLRHEEIVRPNYYRSEGYNEFFRWMGMHHGLLTLLRDERGNFVGYYPIFRSEKMKAFSRDDVEFLKTAAGFIAQGIRTASLVSFLSVEDRAFEPFPRVPQGVVVMDCTGKVLSINRAAQSLFHQFSIYEGSGIGSAVKGGLSQTFDHIARQLRVIFGNQDQACLDAQQPIIRIYSHCSGATLRLRGFASDVTENGGHFTVLIELGETEQLLRQRIAARYNLSRRQAELLMLLRRGTNNKEIAELLSASRSALKSSLRELRLKLDLGGGSSLREVARLI